jgi:hypothetical protein
MACEKWIVDGRPCYVTMSDQYKIRAAGKEFYFSFHAFTGPGMLDKRGNAVQKMPPQKSPFWDALYWWLKQGKKVDAEGYCVFKWEMKPIHILKHLGGRHYQVLGSKHKQAV